MDYNHVALFVRVVKAGSFTAAAQAVGLPKSSVSRSVARLEQEVGVRLLERTTRKLVLTAAGQAYYESVRAAVAGIDEADAAVRELGATPRGVVRLTAPPDLGVELAAVLSRFTRKYPAIRVECALTSRTVDIVSEGFDLAVRAGRLDDSALVVRRIGITEAGLFASSAYLRRRGRPKSFEELPEHDWVLYHAHAGRSLIRLSDADNIERSVEVTGSLMADDIAFCCAAAEAGSGIAFLPVTLAIEPVLAGRLEHVLPNWMARGATLNVVMPSGRYVPARVALVRDLLVDFLTRKLEQSQRQCGKQAAARVSPRT